MNPVRLVTRVLACTVLWIAVVPTPAAGQDPDSVNLQWWHPLVASAGIATLFLIDEPVRDYVQDHRSASLDDVGQVAAKFHEPEVFIVSGTGAMALGLLIREPKVAQTGLQILASYGLASGVMIGTKWVFGRSRPNAAPDDATKFEMMSGGDDSAFPSGASTVTFSLATTLADAIGHPAATIVLYAGATLNAWARVNADRHWVSDVALGALYGITAAKLVNGRWRIFGLRPPTAGIDQFGRATLRFDAGW
jgi:membrane-associated phospholipid phosphatase